MKEINKMTRKDFMSVPVIDNWHEQEIDSIILVPDKHVHDSGYSYFTVILCNNLRPVERLRTYDTLSIYSIFENQRFRIDCLNKSKCIRIIFRDVRKYHIDSTFYELKGGK